MSNQSSFNQKILKNHNLKPQKRLGQNFLLNSQSIAKMIDSANIGFNEIVVEVGPGLGSLTYPLAQKAQKIIAIEKDSNLSNLLLADLKTKNIKNVVVLNQDILDFNPASLKFNRYKVVANLPYYITNPVIMLFLEAQNPPLEMILMVQKEVGQRICAVPPNSNKLATFCQFYSQVKIIASVSRNNFWPAPKVDSVIIEITPIDQYKKQVPTAIFSQVVKAGFSQPRKQLLNNFSSELNQPKENISKWLVDNKISPSQRAQNLTLENWIVLAQSFVPRHPEVAPKRPKDLRDSSATASE
jgi:16S rRNA (adenine1518-N6/adenine1519-N6)-dimethyltransferase